MENTAARKRKQVPEGYLIIGTALTRRGMPQWRLPRISASVTNVSSTIREKVWNPCYAEPG